MRASLVFLTFLLISLSTIHQDDIHSWCYYSHRYGDWVFVETTTGFGGKIMRNYYFGPAENCK